VDRIVIIKQGQIVANGTSQELMSSMRGHTQLTLAVKYASEETLAGIGSRVDGIELVDTESVEGQHVLSIEYERGTDPREEIFNYAKDSGWTILEMSQTAVLLEDVFRSLTAEGGDHA
jgi:ABC-type multidrug transport system ATPase subunit